MEDDFFEQLAIHGEFHGEYSMGWWDINIGLAGMVDTTVSSNDIINWEILPFDRQWPSARGKYLLLHVPECDPTFKNIPKFVHNFLVQYMLLVVFEIVIFLWSVILMSLKMGWWHEHCNRTVNGSKFFTSPRVAMFVLVDETAGRGGEGIVFWFQRLMTLFSVKSSNKISDPMIRSSATCFCQVSFQTNNPAPRKRSIEACKTCHSTVGGLNLRRNPSGTCPPDTNMGVSENEVVQRPLKNGHWTIRNNMWFLQPCKWWCTFQGPEYSII